ncbi:MAG: oligosaccharide flippase family protein [Anaerolineae bacterium]
MNFNALARRWPILSRTAGMQQGLLLVTAVTFAYGLDYLFNLASGRLLEPAEFGILIALSGVGQVLVVASRVIQTVVTRYVSRFQAADEEAGRTVSFFRAMFRAAWFWGALATATAVLLSFPLARFLRIEAMGPVLALAVTTLLMVVRPVVGGALQGVQRFGALGAVQVIQAALRLALGVALMWLGWGALGAMASLPAASLAALLFGWLVLQRALFAVTPRPHQVSLPEMFRYSTVTAAGLISFALLINMDAILVRHYFDPVTAGHYSAAVTLGKVIQFFPVAVIMVLFPKAARRHAGKRDTGQVLLPAMLAVAVFCGAIALVYLLFGGAIVRLTLGSAYRVDGRLLGWVGGAMLTLSLANIWLNFFLSTERPRFVALILAGIVVQWGLMARFHQALWQLPAAMLLNGLWLTAAGGFMFRRRR